MSSATTICSYLIWFLVCLSGSDQRCVQNQDGRSCVSFDEISDNLWSLQFRVADDVKTVKLQTFSSPNSTNVNSIVKLTILKSLNNINVGAFKSFKSLKYLTITNNSLSLVTADMFEASELTSLVLNDNQIKVLEGGFHKTPNLRALYISRNLLKKVTGSMLEGLDYLEILNLDHNLIETIEPETFSKTPLLINLSLDYNMITVLHPSIFSIEKHESLEILHLSHNKLTFLEKDLLDRLSELRTIRLGGNPWQCFCLELLLKWLDDMNVQKSCKDFPYFDGAKPICVPAARKECEIYYDEKYYVTYRNISKLYPQEETCDSMWSALAAKITQHMH